MLSSSTAQKTEDNINSTTQSSKPRDKPKRPLSAYNLFFRFERNRILSTTSQPKYKPRRSHGKIGFAALARQVADKWKNLDDNTRATFEAKAAIEKERYDKEIDEWNRARIARMSNYASPPTMPEFSDLERTQRPSLKPVVTPTKGFNPSQSTLASMTFDTLQFNKGLESFQAFNDASMVNTTNGLLQVAMDLCKDATPSVVTSDVPPVQPSIPSADFLDFAPIKAECDQSLSSNGSLRDLAALFDDECFDIMQSLKTCP